MHTFIKRFLPRNLRYKFPIPTLSPALTESPNSAACRRGLQGSKDLLSAQGGVQPAAHQLKMKAPLKLDPGRFSRCPESNIFGAGVSRLRLIFLVSKPFHV